MLLSACADTHHLKRTQGAGIASNQRSSAYIALPKDGSFGSAQYTGSGAMVAQEIGAAFSPYMRETVTGAHYEPMDAAVTSASKGEYDYLIYPKILHWEDRDTEWSGRPDVTPVKVTIIDVSSGKVVDSGIIGGESKIMSWGGDRPEDLLSKPLADYAAELFN